MRTAYSILATMLCAVHCCSAAAQKVTGSDNIPKGLSFNYDAANDQILASGMSYNSPNGSPGQEIDATIEVSIAVDLDSRHLDGDDIRCSVLAIGGVIDPITGTVAGGQETANARARRAPNGNAVCKFTIPFTWTIPSATSPAAQSGLIIVYGAEDKCDGMVRRSTLQVDGIENLPATATTAKFSFQVTL